MSKFFAHRRDFLKQAGIMGSAAMMAAMPDGAMALGGSRGAIIEDAVLPAGQPDAAPKYHIKFGVCGMSHDHIYGLIDAVASEERQGRSLRQARNDHARATRRGAQDDRRNQADLRRYVQPA